MYNLFNKTFNISNYSKLAPKEGCSNPGCGTNVVTKLCTVRPDIFGSPVRNWLHVTNLRYKILRWLQFFWKIYASVEY